MSTSARTRRRRPCSIKASTCPFRFSTPPSTRTSGAVGELACTGLDEQFRGDARVEPLAYAPGEDAPREVVNHSMEECLGAVEQADDRGVDVPDRVGPLGARAVAGPAGMEPESRPAPPEARDEPVPGRGRREDLAQALGKEREPAGRDMPVGGRGDHVFDRGDLLGREGMGREARTGVGVVKVAAACAASPGCEPGGREAKGCEEAGQPTDAARALHGAKEPELLSALGDAHAREVGLKDAQQREEDVHHGAQLPKPALKAHDARAEGGRRLFEQRVGDHGRGGPPEPPVGRGAWHAPARGELGVASALHEFDEPVVVGLLGWG